MRRPDLKATGATARNPQVRKGDAVKADGRAERPRGKAGPIHAFPHAPARLKKAAQAAKLSALFETLGSSETLGAGAFGDRPDSGA